MKKKPTIHSYDSTFRWHCRFLSTSHSSFSLSLIQTATVSLTAIKFLPTSLASCWNWYYCILCCCSNDYCHDRDRYDISSVKTEVNLAGTRPTNTRIVTEDIIGMNLSSDNGWICRVGMTGDLPGTLSVGWWRDTGWTSPSNTREACIYCSDIDHLPRAWSAR